MNEIAVNMADLLVAELVALEIPAERGYLPSLEPEDEGLRVFVVAAGHTPAIHSRGRTQHDIELRIILAKRLADGQDVSEMDGCTAVAAKVKELFENPELAAEIGPHCGVLRNKRLGGMSFLSLNHNPLYEVAALNERNEYLSQIVLTYRAAR